MEQRPPPGEMGRSEPHLRVMTILPQLIVLWTLALRVGAGGLTVAARALLLLGLFPSVLCRLMMTDDTAGAGAENAVMAGIMPGDGADSGALQAARRQRWSRNPGGRRFPETVPVSQA